MIHLADIQQGRSIVDGEGRPQPDFVRTINGNTRNVKQVLQELQQAVIDIQTTLGIANAAQAAAGAAQATATASLREVARINSYTSPTAVLSAEDAGTDATITIINHDRVYPVQGAYDVPDLAVTGTAIPGLAYATEYFPYYDDPTLADATPTFGVTLVAGEAQAGFAPGRHSLGSIVTPAAGAPPTEGDGPYPPGGREPLV